MSQANSPSAKRRYGLERVCRVWQLARSTVYARRGAKTSRHRPGPVGACTDAELVEHLRAVLSGTPWVEEGYRKAWARLRRDRGVRTAPRRVLRVMREAGLQAPVGTRHARGPETHDRSITPARPDVLWGTDATGTLTAQGQATIFLLIDHCTAECLGIHAALRGTRFEALEPLRQAVRARFGKFEADVGTGIGLRHDHGSQFLSHAYQQEVRFLGLRSTPAFVAEPQGNGCAERFIRTLKQQLLWLRRFETVEALEAALHEFKDRYNREWLIARHGYVSPSEQHRRLTAPQESAA
jgi:putative transposase